MNATNSFARFTRSISALSISISFRPFSEKLSRGKLNCQLKRLMLTLVGLEVKRKMNQPYNAGVMAGRPATKEAPMFGQRLAALRRGKGLSQTQLADLLDTTRKMIDYYERRAGNPSLDFIQRAAEALDVSVAELLGSEPN